MPEGGDWNIESYAWVGPQVMTANGLELHAVVAEDQKGVFHAGTRYGPRGGAMPELGHEEFWCMETYGDKNSAILAATADVTAALRQCNDQKRTEALLEKTTSSKGRTKALPITGRSRQIDR